MTHALPKFLVCLFIALVSTAIPLLLRGRTREETWLRGLSVAAWSASFVLAAVVYSAFPGAVQFSDAVVFYLPETRALLDGQLPYQGFATSYAPLFHVLLALPVAVWDSAGAITLFMILAEGLLLGAYLHLCARQKRSLLGWRTTWLVVSSPAVLYWTGVGGYNSILIASFSMVGLVLAQSGRPLASGFAGAMSFLGCKLLGVLSWPTIVLYRRGASLRRILPMVLAVLGLGLLLALGFDVWMPIRREAGGWSDGNAWFLLATIFPSVYEASAVDLLAPAAFLLAYGLGTIRFLRGRGSDSAPAGSSPNAEREFDRATAHLAWAMVAFLVFSKKTMGMYPPMALPFVVHTLLSRDGDRLRVATLFPILLIGATATVFPNMNWLGEFVRSRAFLASGDGALLLVAQVAKLVALAAMGRAAWTLLGSRDLGRAPSVR